MAQNGHERLESESDLQLESNIAAEANVGIERSEAPTGASPKTSSSPAERDNNGASPDAAKDGYKKEWIIVASIVTVVIVLATVLPVTLSKAGSRPPNFNYGQPAARDIDDSCYFNLYQAAHDTFDFGCPNSVFNTSHDIRIAGNGPPDDVADYSCAADAPLSANTSVSTLCYAMRQFIANNRSLNISINGAQLSGAVVCKESVAARAHGCQDPFAMDLWYNLPESELTPADSTGVNCSRLAIWDCGVDMSAAADSNCVRLFPSTITAKRDFNLENSERSVWACEPCRRFPESMCSRILGEGDTPTVSVCSANIQGYDQLCDYDRVLTVYRGCNSTPPAVPEQLPCQYIEEVQRLVPDVHIVDGRPYVVDGTSALHSSLVVEQLAHNGNPDAFLLKGFQATNNTDRLTKIESPASAHARPCQCSAADVGSIRRGKPRRSEITASSWSSPTPQFFKSSSTLDLLAAVSTGNTDPAHGQPLLHRIRQHAEGEELSNEERETISASWARGGLGEHASVASFARLTLDLMAVGAPPHLVMESTNRAQDEIRHAQLCFALASMYASVSDEHDNGAKASSPSPFPEHTVSIRNDKVALARAVFLDGSVNEALAAKLLEYRAEAILASSHPNEALHTVIASIASDERRHAEFAARTLEWILSEGVADPSLRNEVLNALANAKEESVAMFPKCSLGAKLHTARANLISDMKDQRGGILPEKLRATAEAIAFCEILPGLERVLAGHANRYAEVAR